MPNHVFLDRFERRVASGTRQDLEDHELEIVNGHGRI